MTRTRPPLVRMQHIDRALRDNRYPNCSQIAAYFEVSRKCILRDIDCMRDQLGAPIDYDSKRKGYFYKGPWRFDPSTLIDRNEAEALAATQRVLAQYQGTPYYEEVSRAIEKLMQTLPTPLAGNGLLDIYSFEHPAVSQFDERVFTLLEMAIRRRRSVEITYRSPSSQTVTQRILQPYRLHYDQFSATWYLIAWCEYRQGVRTFAVGRISDPRLTGNEFTVPSIFNVSDFLEKAFHQTIGPETYDILIRFTPYQAQWIREHVWHSSQQIEEHNDGSLTLKLSVSSLDAVKRWVMRYGAHAEVLEPEQLRDMVRQEAEKMVEVYGDKEGDN